MRGAKVTSKRWQRIRRSGLGIKAYCAAAASSADYVFAFMHRLRFRFAMRILDLFDKRLDIYGDAKQHPTLPRYERQR